MSAPDEEPYSTIFASLKHPIRRRILRMLSEKSMSFSEMLEVLGVSNSFLTYHLENLGELVGKTDDGRYKLSSFGEAAISTMTKVEDIPTTAPHQSPETRPKKIVGRSIAIALGIICILLIASLGGTVAFYTMAIDNKDSHLNTMDSEISELNTTINQLNTTINSLEAPNLIEVNMTAKVNSTAENNTNYFAFHVFGSLCNVGTSTAYDCEFEVILHIYEQTYQPVFIWPNRTYLGQIFLNGTMEYMSGPISLGNVSGHSWIPLNWSLPTQPGTLVNWTVIPAWAGHTDGIITIPSTPIPTPSQLQRP